MTYGVINVKSTVLNLGRLPNYAFKKIAKDITLCLAKECSLRCKYCYRFSKNGYKKLSRTTAMKAVDCETGVPDIYNQGSVVGGYWWRATP